MPLSLKIFLLPSSTVGHWQEWFSTQLARKIWTKQDRFCGEEFCLKSYKRPSLEHRRFIARVVFRERKLVSSSLPPASTSHAPYFSLSHSSDTHSHTHTHIFSNSLPHATRTPIHTHISYSFFLPSALTYAHILSHSLSHTHRHFPLVSLKQSVWRQSGVLETFVQWLQLQRPANISKNRCFTWSHSGEMSLSENLGEIILKVHLVIITLANISHIIDQRVL